MKKSKSEKYLGDTIAEIGNIQVTINSRRSKVAGIVAEFTSIIEEIPFGKYRLEVAMKLREAILIYGILYNNEAWHEFTDKKKIIKLLMKLY